MEGGLNPLALLACPLAGEPAPVAGEGLEGRVAGVCSRKPAFGVPGRGAFGQGLDNLCYRRHTLRMRKKWDDVRNLGSQ